MIHNNTIDSDDVLRPTVVEVSLQQISDNFAKIKKATAQKVMPILKANAYGHGLLRVAQHMQSLNADYLGVAFLEEGLLLRKNGITSPILILGGIMGNQIPHFIKNDLTITASSLSKLEQIDKTAGQLKKKAKVHLKVDTGLERIGVHYYNAENFIVQAAQYKNIVIEGIFSHFANADSKDLTHAKLQLERFQQVLNYYEQHDLAMPELVHMANSGAILQLPESHFNMVRPGIILYGVYPSLEVEKTITLHPALSWKSRVVYFKVITPGHPVGYGSTWQTDKNNRAITIPVGYGDGYFRCMSNKAEVIVRGQKFSVIGTISMDQIVVNIGDKSAYNDDEVILIGTQDEVEVTCEDLADWANTIPYEVLTNINTRVPRVYK